MLDPPGSSGPGHRILLVTETRCLPVPRLRTNGDGCAPGTTGGDPRSLTACWHRWRCCTSWVPHSHSLGRWWQVEGSQGALSTSLPWNLPGKVPGCGAAAPLVLGARRARKGYSVFSTVFLLLLLLVVAVGCPAAGFG